MDHTVAQLDFVLEMAARDEPEKWVFNRQGRAEARDQPEALAAWHNVLAGPLALRFMMRTGVADAQARVAAWRQKRGGLRPGITRGGKPVEGTESSLPVADRA